MKPTIYLDMDGTCCDFNKAALEIFDRKDLITDWPKDEYSVSKVLGISNKEFWEVISKKKDNFWSELEEFPWFKDMYKELSKLGEVYFCTSPARDPNCVKGKLMWLQERLGEDFEKYIFIKDKFLLARPDNFLVDDFEKQCEDFSKSGGNVILFPQPWNSNRDIENRLSFVLSSIKNRIKQ